jgi:hypothetical protein
MERSGVQRGGARRARQSVGHVCARRCDPEAKSLLVLHDAVNNGDDDAWGEKRGGESARSGTARCEQREMSTSKRILHERASQRTPALACAASRRKEYTVTEGGYNNKTMAVSVWREGKVSKTHLVHCSGVVSSAVGVVCSNRSAGACSTPLSADGCNDIVEGRGAGRAG